jgi:hypothetical protein
LGGQGDYALRAAARRLGRTGRKWGRIWELTGSDPHPRSLTRIVMNVESLAA